VCENIRPKVSKVAAQASVAAAAVVAALAAVDSSSGE
jgi:hypothetical protein